MRMMMMRGIALLLLVCQQMDVHGHTLSRHTANINTKLKSLLQQFEEILNTEETSDRDTDYDEINRGVMEQSPVSTAWDREDDVIAAEDSNPAEGYETQRKRLMDLLMSTRSKSLSGCFGGRLDRIGSTSTLGCNSKKG
ncbi:natriuretic peptides A [Triplophysa dalaica]|uniref:natriuretic peptides A n=1 Tax=Triplophysa dalaica TaxID=1582913 RepID=UPI0024DFA318|nr:natriuretic peptides A [Triplophysa dalaica]